MISVMLSLFVAIMFLSQRGYIFSSFGAFMNLACPPADLYSSQCSQIISVNENVYECTLHHKYSGKYVVSLKFKRLSGVERIKHNLNVKLELYDGDEKVLERYTKNGLSQFWGDEIQGIHLCSYRFPQDVSQRDVKARIEIDGDIRSLTSLGEDIVISIGKGSDL